MRIWWFTVERSIFLDAILFLLGCIPYSHCWLTHPAKCPECWNIRGLRPLGVPSKGLQPSLQIKIAGYTSIFVGSNSYVHVDQLCKVLAFADARWVLGYDAPYPKIAVTKLMWSDLILGLRWGNFMHIASVHVQCQGILEFVVGILRNWKRTQLASHGWQARLAFFLHLRLF